jgi:hypothetical protein
VLGDERRSARHASAPTASNPRSWPAREPAVGSDAAVGSRPIAVSTAPVPSTQRSNTHASTRLFSP